MPEIDTPEGTVGTDGVALREVVLAVFLAAFLAAGVANYCLASRTHSRTSWPSRRSQRSTGATRKTPPQPRSEGESTAFILSPFGGVRDAFIWEFGGFRRRDFRETFERKRERERWRRGGCSCCSSLLPPRPSPREGGGWSHGGSLRIESTRTRQSTQPATRSTRRTASRVLTCTGPGRSSTGGAAGGTLGEGTC